jgi:lipopolysaccharide/colanic/teichoic acid biosynthesis glycosyltransferase
MFAETDAHTLNGPPGLSPGNHPVRRDPGGLRRPAITPRGGWYAYVKGAAGYLVALLLLVPAGVLILGAIILVKLTSRGPAFYTQTRVGRHGRCFTIYKIRTMFHNCERLTGPRWASVRDPRVTPVGRFLRWAHIDELPQLWNVLRGEMSLVGPRPERPEFLPKLVEAIPLYQDRHQLRPGITGLAQVQLPADTSLNSVRIKLAYDLYYVQRFSLWLDLRIILATFCGVLGIPFAVSNRLLRLPHGEPVEAAYEAVAAAAAVGPHLTAYRNGTAH